MACNDLVYQARLLAKEYGLEIEHDYTYDQRDIIIFLKNGKPVCRCRGYRPAKCLDNNYVEFTAKAGNLPTINGYWVDVQTKEMLIGD